MADVIPFLAYSLFPLNPIYFTHNKENNIRNIVRVLMFEQLLANKHNKLRDSKFGWEKVWVWSTTKRKKKYINKHSVEHDPCSAHGHMVN